MKHSKKNRENFKDSPKIKVQAKKVSDSDLEKIVGGARPQKGL